MIRFKEFINETAAWQKKAGKKPYSPGSCKLEDAGGAAAVAGPTNVTAGVAGIGAQGPKSNQSEPGVNMKKRTKSPILLGMVNRKPPKI